MGASEVNDVNKVGSAILVTKERKLAMPTLPIQGPASPSSSMQILATQTAWDLKRDTSCCAAPKHWLKYSTIEVVILN